MSQNEELKCMSNKMVDVHLVIPERAEIIYIGTCIAPYNSLFVREILKGDNKEFYFVGLLSIRNYEPPTPLACGPEDWVDQDDIDCDSEEPF